MGEGVCWNGFGCMWLKCVCIGLGFLVILFSVIVGNFSFVFDVCSWGEFGNVFCWLGGSFLVLVLWLGVGIWLVLGLVFWIVCGVVLYFSVVRWLVVRLGLVCCVWVCVGWLGVLVCGVVGSWRLLYLLRLVWFYLWLLLLGCVGGCCWCVFWWRMLSFVLVVLVYGVVGLCCCWSCGCWVLGGYCGSCWGVGVFVFWWWWIGCNVCWEYNWVSCSWVLWVLLFGCVIGLLVDSCRFVWIIG